VWIAIPVKHCPFTREPSMGRVDAMLRHEFWSRNLYLISNMTCLTGARLAEWTRPRVGIRSDAFGLAPSRDRCGRTTRALACRRPAP
jgi:hypothetical protein